MSERYFVLRGLSGSHVGGEWNEFDCESESCEDTLRPILTELARTIARNGGMDTWHLDGDAAWTETATTFEEVYVLARTETPRFNKAGFVIGRDVRERILTVTAKRLAPYLNRLPVLCGHAETATVRPC